jgi:BASS family bile acid:Na+ symporter
MVLGGTALQYTVMPLLAFTFGRLLALDAAAMVGIAMVGCVPGAMASNVLTLNARGNTSYSVSLTTAATLLSPVAVPAGLWLLLSDRVTIDPWAVSGNLLLTVVLPVVAGHFVGRAFSAHEVALRWVGSKIANLAILWIIAVVVGLNREHLTEIQTNVFVALLGINAGGYLAGWFGGRMLAIPTAMRRALTLEIGMQNAGLGAVLATTFFKDQPQAAIAPAMYTFGCMLTGTVLATVWRTAVCDDREPRD